MVQKVFGRNTIFFSLKKLKIYENVSQKSLWQSFENEKSETAIFFVFPCSSQWCTPFFLSTHFSPRKSQNKIACFDFFEKSWKKAILFRNFLHEKCIDRKKSTPRQRAWKNQEDGHLRFLIFETLSHRFLQNIFRNFHFLKKKTTNSLLLTQISSNHFLSENRPTLNLTFN